MLKKLKLVRISVTIIIEKLIEKVVRNMAISEGKKRIMITLEEGLIEKIKQIAKNNRRRVSDEIAILIEKSIKEKEEN